MLNTSIQPTTYLKLQYEVLLKKEIRMEITQANVIAIKIINDDFKSRPNVYLNDGGELDASKFALAVNELAQHLSCNCVTLSRPQLQLLLANMD